MKVIPTLVHGILDYVLGFFLLFAPEFFDLFYSEEIQWIPRTFGTLILLLNVATRHEVGLLKMFSMKAHLGFDYIMGAVLAVSPWIFGFSHVVWKPYLFSGLLILILAFLSKKETLSTYADPT